MLGIALGRRIWLELEAGTRRRWGAAGEATRLPSAQSLHSGASRLRQGRFMKIDNRKVWFVRARISLRVVAIVSALSVISCGGGDGGGASQVALTRNDAVPGDYFIYEVTTTTAAGGLATTRNSIVSYRSVAADGSNQRVAASGGGNSFVPIQRATYNVDGGLVSVDSLSPPAVPVCTFTVPLALTPSFPRAVGQTWSNTTIRTCSTLVTTIVTTGTVVARENLTLPVGTVDTWRTTRAVTFTGSGGVTAQQLTCWYSVARGVMVRCDTVSQSGTTAESTTTEVLTSAGGPTRASEGNVHARFQGPWYVSYSGASSGVCGSLAISSNGTVSGSCVPVGGAAFTVNGTVDVNGVVNVTWPGGGMLTGTLTAPYEGSGTWSEGTNSGTWTARHS